MKRPLGITILAGLMTFVGGLSSVILIIEIIDSLRFSGINSILITNPASFVGFILYGMVPVIFYSTGISLFLGRAWTRNAVVFVIAPLAFMLFMNLAYKSALLESRIYNAEIEYLIVNHPSIFIKHVFSYACIMVPALYYLNLPNVIEYLEKYEIE